MEIMNTTKSNSAVVQQQCRKVHEDFKIIIFPVYRINDMTLIDESSG